MEYRIQVDPDKTDDFLQLLRTWKRLGIIEDFQLNDPQADTALALDSPRRIFFAPDTADDYTNQYRDLVD